MSEKFAQPDWNFFQNFLQHQQDFLQTWQKKWDPESFAKGQPGFEAPPYANLYKDFLEKNKDAWESLFTKDSAQSSLFGNLFAKNPFSSGVPMLDPLHAFFQMFLLSQKFISSIDSDASKNLFAEWEKMRGEIFTLFLSSLPTKVPLPNGEYLDFSVEKEWSKLWKHSVEPFESWLKTQPTVFLQVAKGEYSALVESYKN